jgi:hypothetical protein
VDTVELFPAGASVFGDADVCPTPESAASDRWPRDVEMILSAMDAAHAEESSSIATDSFLNRRELPRTPYRVKASLRLFSDQVGTPAWTLYTRDVNRRSISFVTPHRLPLGYGGWVEILSPAGRLMKINCTLFRCREAVKGWFEGALSFNREQGAFETER